MTTTEQINAAASRLLVAKTREAEATAERIAAEEQLTGLLPTKDEGTVSTTTDQVKVSVNYSLRRTVDEAALDAVRKALPPALFARLFRFKPDVNVRELKYVQSNEPDFYAATVQAVVTRPSKPSVRVDLIETVEASIAKAA
jgi:hypothetical protein